MGEHVGIEVAALEEGPSTDIALMRFHTRVSKLVLSEKSTLSEGHAAFIT